MKDYKVLRGRTYSIKHIIKAAGGKWDLEKKCWLVPIESYEEIKSKMPEKVNSKNKNKPSLFMKW